ncbi:hypothetical protein J3R30DRAFT_3752561 [Lentinula aciculospora]|uniref:Lipoprotein n=1 Tax=Lentinula aciculospora TaxID=153920 RepID=A0A9W9DYZ4_9AGAR|nr:hypothetical protein J3R30DRAFT_3752561 [Lentinula aciculospora]
MSLLYNTFFWLLSSSCAGKQSSFKNTIKININSQTSLPTQTEASSSTITAVLSTVALGGFNAGGINGSNFKQDSTTISLIEISSDRDGDSETTYSREIIISDGVLTTTTDGSFVPNTLVTGNVVTEIETLVENASGYYMTAVDEFTTGTTHYIEGTYETCSFVDAGAGAASAGCSDSDYLVEMPTNGDSTTTVYHSTQFF